MISPAIEIHVVVAIPVIIGRRMHYIVKRIANITSLRGDSCMVYTKKRYVLKLRNMRAGAAIIQQGNGKESKIVFDTEIIYTHKRSKWYPIHR